ncbi:MAG: hypothetical protein GXP48_05875 [Acidobacteria bacterium]|nr:hypothetical protein [Acidobacteriota bacterium]
MTGIEWLNGACATAGFLPQTSVLLLEAPTVSDGGLWAAIKVDHNAADANFDLDAAAARICGPSCAAVASPYAGGFGQGIDVLGADEAGGVLTLKLAWKAPRPSGEALDDTGEDLITSYTVYVARSVAGVPPGMTGGKDGWVRIDDTDNKQTGGYSTDTRATVSVNLGGSSEGVYVALGLNFDGVGNPDTNANTVASSYISRGTLVYVPGNAAPLATSVSPSEGSTAGGEKIVIMGTGLAGATTTVSVGGNPATGVIVASGSRIEAITPAGVPGAADVVVTTPAGSSTLAAGYRYLDLPPVALAVDEAMESGTTGDLNGVLEPGETVTLVPSWENLTGGPQTLTGHAGGCIGPAGATYSTTVTEADYGTVGAGASATCSDGSMDCYEVGVTVPASRPALHWDARFEEVLSTGEVKTWTVHVGASFGDVAPGAFGYRFIETMLHAGVTAGCGGGNYCPGNLVSRSQMAVFLLKAKHGSTYAPPPCTGVFNDVACPGGFAVDWIEELAAEGVTAGCGGGNYCPGSPVSRSQMAVFLLKAKHGSTYTPPPCTGVFNDVACPGGFAVDWIEELAAEGVTAGCGGGNYCPNDSVSRSQMAVFLTKNFNLLLYGP